MFLLLTNQEHQGERHASNNERINKGKKEILKQLSHANPNPSFTIRLSSVKDRLTRLNLPEINIVVQYVYCRSMWGYETPDFKKMQTLFFYF